VRFVDHPITKIMFHSSVRLIFPPFSSVDKRLVWPLLDWTSSLVATNSTVLRYISHLYCTRILRTSVKTFQVLVYYKTQYDQNVSASGYSLVI
jgi:hypothetical protein